jgi:hypothetical protein
MSVQKLPSGNWRAQVHDPRSGTNVSVGKVLGGTSTFATKREAKAAREKAREALAARGAATGASVGTCTVKAWRDRWLTDPLFARPKDSTMIRYAEQTKHFAARYGALLLDELDDDVAAEWCATGKTPASTVPGHPRHAQRRAREEGGARHARREPVRRTRTRRRQRQR